ncbi:RGCVC family protein [Amycolatopsis sp. WQ 127309]|uniref:RGCVC family protein n=1 Tax=Amycolatopsis sp. WQ 127309 TaxID=2932773 RepID=UPI001FF45CCB|nr:RGCVC family protein [Amycolatopsis sp. WQ 127309]UOZ08596.1 RGCVC family protein [Amycolatopsis sp. WQ 127309]
MTAPAPDALETSATGPQCPNCPHPLDAHDAIARRYCAATAAGQGVDRGCVCGTAQDHQKKQSTGQGSR